MKRKILGIFTAVVMMFSYTVLPAFAENDDSTDSTAAAETVQTAENGGDGTSDTEQGTQEDSFSPPEYVPEFSFPNEMRAVKLVPGVDFALSDEETAEEIYGKCGEMMNVLSGKTINAVIIETNYDGKAYYSADLNETVRETPVETAIRAAKDNGMFVYLTFDINYALGQMNGLSLQDRIDRLAITAHTFTVKNRVNGIILKGYYSSKNRTSFDDYMENGSGIGFDNWLMDNGAYVFSLVSDAIRKTNNTVPVGIYLSDVWANYSDNEGGSQTNDTFQALTDGYSDTLGYIKNGFADFLMVEAEGSLTDPNLPFEQLVSWWAEAAKGASIPMFVMHDNDKICTDETGWASPDQLIHQIRKCREISGYTGSAFRSYTALCENRDGANKALVEYFNETLNMETIDNELNIVSPTKFTFTTEEPTYAFMGSFDSNFDVYFNGEIIKLNDAGNFYYEVDLDIGLNTFTIKNKAKVLTYNITRNITVLKSIEPATNMEVEGSSQLSINAVAYKGSYVTAKINGASIKLTETDATPDGYENTSYVKFVGSYTVPKGIIGKTQNLGNVVIYGSYQGKKGKTFNENITGGKIIVNALPEVPNNADGSLIRVRNDNTYVYDYRTTNSYKSPNLARQPKGTLDYVVKQVTYSSIPYYLTLSGKRFKATDVDVLPNEPIGQNNINIVSVTQSGYDTVIKLQLNRQTPFSMSLGGINYTTGANGNYYVPSFSASTVSLTFDYTNSVNGSLDLSSTNLFSAASWSDTSTEAVARNTLTLKLAQTGKFGGVTATYEDGNVLTLRFNSNPGSLAGTVIVLDPGHGLTSAGKIDPGGVGHITDQSVGQALSRRLVTLLSNEGATVYRLPTESQFIDTEQRSAYARQYSPDIFISIHGNKAAASTAKGTEAFYFTPWSEPLAAAVSSNVAAYFTNNVYADHADKDRGAKYNEFWVTLQQDFASILVEIGFVSNYEDAMAMSNETHLDGIANAMVRGIKQYLGR